jgi:hypothetical protein
MATDPFYGKRQLECLAALRVAGRGSCSGLGARGSESQGGLRWDGISDGSLLSGQSTAMLSFGKASTPAGMCRRQPLHSTTKTVGFTRPCWQ